MGLSGLHVAVLGLAACGSGGGFPDAKPIDVMPPGGTFTLDWAVVDGNNQNLTCDRIGAQTVTVLTHNRAFAGGSTQVFTCSTGMGQSQALIAGDYDFDFELDASGSMQLATAPGQHDLTITSGQNTLLTPLTFTVDATGALSLNLSTGKVTNCGGSSNDGRITSTTITLVHTVDQTCEPVTFNISASTIGSEPAGTYTVNCTTPTVGPCIEADQLLTATNVPSDNYTVHVKGNIGASTCWSNNDSLQLPPLGQTLMRTLNLGYAPMGTPGC